MQHELALALGGTIGELRQRMSSSEFTAWQGYARHWPIGPRRLDLLFANLYALVARAVGGNKAPKRLEAYDPFPDGGTRSSPLANKAKQRALKQMAIAATRVLGGKVTRKGDNG